MLISIHSSEGKNLAIGNTSRESWLVTPPMVSPPYHGGGV
jgi:hypothetical protein